MSSTLFFVIFFLQCFLVEASALSCAREAAIEHLFFDLTPQRRNPKGAANNHNNGAWNEDQLLPPSPVSVKLKCKGDGCPFLNGTRAVIKAVPGHEHDVFSEAPMWCEETSGWILFWKDEDWKEPAIATVSNPQEIRNGYVYVVGEKQRFAGKVAYDCH